MMGLEDDNEEFFLHRDDCKYFDVLTKEYKNVNRELSINSHFNELGILYYCVMFAIGFAALLKEQSVDSNNGTEKKNAIIIQNCIMSAMLIASIGIIIGLVYYLTRNKEHIYENVDRHNFIERDYYYSVKGEGMNIYLRIAVVLFGVLSICYNLVKITNHFRKNCHDMNDLWSIVTDCLMILFFILQSVFIILFDKIVFLRHLRVIGWCLVHLMTMNVNIWAKAAIGKIAISEYNKNCVTTSYFLPPMSEYAVICAAFFMSKAKKMGKPTSILNDHGNHGIHVNIRQFQDNIGYVIGFLIFCVSLIILVINLHEYYILGRKSKWRYTLQNIEELLLISTGIIMSCIVIKYTRSLEEGHCSSTLDRLLLYISFYFTLFYTIDTISVMLKGDKILKFRVAISLLDLIQVVLQTYVINDAFYRYTETDIQIKEKPGKQFICVLMGINLALWIIKSFQSKKSDEFAVLTEKNNKDLIGNISTLFRRCTIPLSMLYRYHSTVCFSELLETMYHKEEIPKPYFSRIEDCKGMSTCSCTRAETKNRMSTNIARLSTLCDSEMWTNFQALTKLNSQSEADISNIDEKKSRYHRRSFLKHSSSTGSVRDLKM